VATWAVAGLLVISPMVGAFSISIWKDIPYVASLTFMTARLVDVTRAVLAGDDAAQRSATWRLFAWGAVATLLRQNGVVVVGIVTLGLLVAVRSSRRLALIGGAGVIAVLVIAKVVVYPLAGVDPAPAHAPYAGPLHDIAAVTNHAPEVLEPDDRRLLATIAPVETWAATYGGFGCDSANWEWDPAFDWTRFPGHEREFADLWLEVSGDATRVVLDNRICVGAIGWSPMQLGDLYTVSRGIDANGLGLRTVPVSHRLNEMANDFIDLSEKPRVRWILWRGVVWTYLGYIALLVAATRTRRRVMLLPGVVLVGLQVSVVPFNPAQDARYMTAGLVVGALLLPLAAISKPHESTVEAEAVPDPDEEETVELRGTELAVPRTGR
jgi:hypothetical protein